MPTEVQTLALVSEAGPDAVEVPLQAPEPLTIGRLTSNDLVLERPEVSRQHAMLTWSNSRWELVDLDSRHGTRLNGVAVAANHPVPLRLRDLIEIAPWTLRIIDPTGAARVEEQAATVPDDDTVGTTMLPIKLSAESSGLVHEQLRILLTCAESIQGAKDEPSLAEAVLDAAVAGTGYRHAAVLRPLRTDGTVDVIARRGDISGDPGRPRLSRTLLRKAAEGMPVQMTGQGSAIGAAVSIETLLIQEAVCVPLMLGSTLAGFLYLDRRGQAIGDPDVVHDAGAFAVGVGRLAALALANLMRRDLELRHARVEGEVTAAGTAQQWILPPREARIGPLRCLGQCRAGRTVSGDFFDIIELDDGRLAITLGDVVGKGVSASVLMTAAQGFLHAALRLHGDPARAVTELNRYLHHRTEMGKFLTLWTGIFDLDAQTVHYVNAGHGYALLAGRDGAIERLDAAGGVPVGVLPETEYSSGDAPFAPQLCVVLVSDGIVEQPGISADETRGEEFGRRRVEQCLRPETMAGRDEVETLFEAVETHAGGAELADDATVVVVRWE